MGQGQAVAPLRPPPSAAGLFRSGGPSASAEGRKLEDVCVVDRSKTLGSGSFGTVWRAKLKKSGLPAAVKAMDKRKMARLNLTEEAVQAEVEFMRECTGKEWFVNLFDFVDTQGMYFIVMELCDGDLEGVAQECEGKLGEQKVVRMMKQMLEGIKFMHSKNIVHRDIKPQNAMIVGKPGSEEMKVKLADFGIAARLRHGQLLTDKVGTPAFMAPEMHLLPSRSAGYDHKVDMWATGAVVVFLLAFEYPFVDGSGRLLKHQLLQGDLPLWDTDVFSGLFQRVQEAAGIRRKRPSKTARDLVRLLLNPKRQYRLSPGLALQHAWFKPGTDYTDQGEDLPLLDWSNFEEGLGSIERELQRVANDVACAAAGVAQAVGSVQIDGGCEGPIPLSPSDDRVRSCVVCYNDSGNLGYLCPQCHHSVCLACLQKLPKPQCPHCRKDASDVALAQSMAKFARKMTKEANGLAAGAVQALDRPLAVDVAVDGGGALAPQTQEEQKRREACHFCKAASSGMSHVCPLCSTSVCLSCAQKELTRKPHCPNCGDVQRNAAALRELLAAGQAWDQLSAVPGQLGARAKDLFGELAKRVPSASPTASPSPSPSRPAATLFPGASRPEQDAMGTRCAARMGVTGRPNPFDTETDFDIPPLPGQSACVPSSSSSRAPAPPEECREERAVLERRLTEQAQLPLRHCCYFCSKESTSLDLACLECGASVCTACLEHIMADDSSCPACGCPEFCNDRSKRLVLSAAKVRDSAAGLWLNLVGMGNELFTAEHQRGPPAPRVGVQSVAVPQPGSAGGSARGLREPLETASPERLDSSGLGLESGPPAPTPPEPMEGVDFEDAAAEEGAVAEEDCLVLEEGLPSRLPLARPPDRMNLAHRVGATDPPGKPMMRGPGTPVRGHLDSVTSL